MVAGRATRVLAAFAIGCRGQMLIARDRCGAPRAFIRPAEAAEPRIAAAEYCTAVRYRMVPYTSAVGGQEPAGFACFLVSY